MVVVEVMFISLFLLPRQLDTDVQQKVGVGGGGRREEGGG